MAKGKSVTRATTINRRCGGTLLPPKEGLIQGALLVFSHMVFARWAALDTATFPRLEHAALLVTIGCALGVFVAGAKGLFKVGRVSLVRTHVVTVALLFFGLFANNLHWPAPSNPKVVTLIAVTQCLTLALQVMVLWLASTRPGR